MTNYPDDEQRYVDRRSQYLAADGTLGLREKVARAVAWHELGYTSNGVATRLDVADSTASSYLDTAQQACPGILTQTVHDVGEPERTVLAVGPPAERECPVCLTDTVCSVGEADAVHRTAGWGATDMLDDADLVCAFCHSVKIDGQWQRMETIDSRAYSLYDAGTKSRSEYRERLTEGIEPGSGSTTDRGVENPEEVDW